VLFSEPKIPQSTRTTPQPSNWYVSVLFSEPKIPQFYAEQVFDLLEQIGFSALQRAENSSIGNASLIPCSSGACFSALQRAENSSIGTDGWTRCCIPRVSVLFSEPKIPQLPEADVGYARDLWFQCSSASRKFLN